MSLVLIAYKALRHPRLRHVPGAWRLRQLSQRLLTGTVHRTPHLQGHAWVHPGNVIADTLLVTGAYEPEVSSVIQTFVRGGFSFVDVGANIGLHTLAAAFARKNDGQRVIAFEPEPSTFELLQRNVASNELEGIECYAMAVGSLDGRLPLYVADGWNQGAHSLSARDETTRQVDVPITRLDTFFAQDSRAPRDNFLMKIDVEGWEPGVLQGAPEWLASATTGAVLVEVFPEMLAKSGASPRDISQALERAGFNERFIIDDPSGRHDTGRPHAYCNMLFLKGVAAARLSQSLMSGLRQLGPRDALFTT